MWLNKTYHTVEGVQRMLPEYCQWFDMKQRCLSKRVQGRRPSYVGCKLHELWSSYDNWMDWAVHQVGFLSKDDLGRNYQIDKDILGCGLLYNPDVCVFVPKEVNQFFIKNHKGFQKLKNGKYRVYGVDESGKRKSLGCFADKTQAYGVWVCDRAIRAKSLGEKYIGLLDSRVIEVLFNVEELLYKRKYPDGLYGDQN